jgi:hypothetical protein
MKFSMFTQRLYFTDIQFHHLYQVCNFTFTTVFVLCALTRIMLFAIHTFFEELFNCFNTYDH